jgi:hypothetical protein
MTALEDAPAASAPVTAGAPTTEEEARALATQWANEQAARLTERVQNYLAQKNGQSNGGVSAHIGEPTTYDPFGNPYVTFDVAATSPIQFIGLPPYQPSKIIKTGEFAFLVAWIFVNPASFQGLPPGTVQLAARPWRMTLDQTNLTTGGHANQVVAGVFPVPYAPVLTPVLFLLPGAGPTMGGDPWLMEANVTVYVDLPGQPYAAFATNFYDIDNDPSFLGIPPTSAGWRNELPNRYLIYP